MRIIVFAETTPALIGACSLGIGVHCPGYCGPEKTVTRRDWKHSTAKAFPAGTEAQAYDKSPRNGGKRVGIVRVTQDPYPESTADIPANDFTEEGFDYLHLHGLRLWGLTPVELWRQWHSEPETLYVVRFELVTLDPCYIVSNR